MGDFDLGPDFYVIRAKDIRARNSASSALKVSMLGCPSGSLGTPSCASTTPFGTPSRSESASPPPSSLRSILRSPSSWYDHFGRLSAQYLCFHSSFEQGREAYR